MTTLHVFSGIPGSQREILAKKFANANGFVFISSDVTRNEMLTKGETINNTTLFEELHRRIKMNLKKGLTVVFDATNLYTKQRKHLLQVTKPANSVCHFVFNSFSSCVENYKSLEKDENIVFQKFMTSEIPFKDEGWNEIQYIIETISKEEIEKIEQNLNNLENSFDCDNVKYASYFMESGKAFFEARPLGEFKKIGYNNMSAQIAFQFLYSIKVDLDNIEEVVKIILLKKRVKSMNENGLEKLKTQIGKDLFDKVNSLIEN